MGPLDPLRRVQRLRQADARRAHDPSDSARIPPGQVETRKFPVLTAEPRIPAVARPDWRFFVRGAVQTPIELGWEAFTGLGEAVTQTCDLHCVTRWSKLDTVWTGLPFRALYEHVTPEPGVSHVMVHAYGDIPGHGAYTTNLPLAELLAEDVLFAWDYDGQPLPPEHGGPMRLLVPRLYLWKSAKWVRGIELLTADAPGFWESYGYHRHGDPWREERFS